eukprot:4784191-Alexandrium_andersonii.AAC.1
MSASLVGSEMCIRDSHRSGAGGALGSCLELQSLHIRKGETYMEACMRLSLIHISEPTRLALI